MTSKPRSSGVALTLTLVLTACGASPERAAEAEAAGAGSGDLLEYTGTLRYAPTPATMTLAGYLGDGIRLERAADAPPVILAPLAIVSEESLAAAADQRVTLRCRPRPASPPSPFEAAPMGPDGQPLPRPAKCEVEALRLTP